MADSEMANGRVVTKRSANALLASRSLSIQRGHQHLLFEQRFDRVFLLACVRHRGRGGIFVSAGVLVSK